MAWTVAVVAVRLWMAAEAAIIGSKGNEETTFVTSCSSANEVDVADVLRPGAVTAFVVSSTGDGDAPDNCDTFFTRLKRAAKAAPGKAGVGALWSGPGPGLGYVNWGVSTRYVNYLCKLGM